MPADRASVARSSTSPLAQWTAGQGGGATRISARPTAAPSPAQAVAPVAATPAVGIAAQLAAMPAPVAIASIGVDLLRIDRIERALARRGERFAAKILGPEEMAKYRARSARDAARGVRFLATRFAAKEAFSKAIGLGMRMPMSWRRVQTLNAPGGRPVLVVAEPLRAWYVERFGAAHVSITDESDMAVAYVVVERLPQEA